MYYLYIYICINIGVCIMSNLYIGRELRLPNISSGMCLYIDWPDLHLGNPRLGLKNDIISPSSPVEVTEKSKRFLIRSETCLLRIKSLKTNHFVFINLDCYQWQKLMRGRS